MTSKIFFLGYNKTATCSIYQLMTTNGIKCQHDSKWDIDKYRAFCDCGDLQDYKKLYEMYPNSYFILNTRNIKDWLLSRLKHGFTYKQNGFSYTKHCLSCKKHVCSYKTHGVSYKQHVF